MDWRLFLDHYFFTGVAKIGLPQMACFVVKSHCLGLASSDFAGADLRFPCYLWTNIPPESVHGKLSLRRDRSRAPRSPPFFEVAFWVPGEAEFGTGEMATKKARTIRGTKHAITLTLFWGLLQRGGAVLRFYWQLLLFCGSGGWVCWLAGWLAGWLVVTVWFKHSRIEPFLGKSNS